MPRKGYKWPDVRRQEYSEYMKQSGRLPPPNKGKVRSEEHCHNISLSKRGDKHPNWHGGKKRHYHNTAMRVYKEHHRYRPMMCSVCATEFNLCVHHINGDYTDNAIGNLKVMCRSHHQMYHRKVQSGENDKLLFTH